MSKETWFKKRTSEENKRYWRRLSRDPEVYIAIAGLAAVAFLAISTGGRYLFPGIIP